LEYDANEDMPPENGEADRSFGTGAVPAYMRCDEEERRMAEVDPDVKPVDQEAFDAVQGYIDDLLAKHADDPIIDGNVFNLDTTDEAES
jgi:hypothetical protein